MTYLFDASGEGGPSDTRNITVASSERYGRWLFPWKALLTTAGWTVIGSGDGNALFEFQGTTAGSGTGTSVWDVLTQDTGASGGVGNASNNNAWCVVQSDQTGEEYLFVGGTNGGGFENQCSVIYNRPGGYTGAGVSATVPPAAVTDELFLNSASRASITTGNPLYSNSGARFIMGANDTAVNGSHGWYALAYDTNFNQIDSVKIAAPLRETISYENWPIVHFGAQSSGNSEGFRDYTLFGLAGQAATNNGTIDTYVQRSTVIGSPNARFEEDLQTGKVDVYDVSWSRDGGSSNEYTAGILEDLMVVTPNLDDGAGNPASYPNYSEQDSDGRTWLFWQNWAVPIQESGTYTSPHAGVEIDTQFNELYFSAGLAADVTPPTVSAYTPVSGSTISASDTVQVTVGEETLIADITVVAQYTNREEVVYRDGAFRAPYAGPSSTSGTFPNLTFTIGRQGGLVAQSVTYVTRVFDGGGNETTGTAVYTVSGAVWPPFMQPFNDGAEP